MRIIATDADRATIDEPCVGADLSGNTGIHAVAGIARRCDCPCISQRATRAGRRKAKGVETIGSDRSLIEYRAGIHDTDRSSGRGNG